MNALPLVTVVINNHNYAAYLREAIESALNQTYPHLEVVVVDDGSTDSSREVIGGYGGHIVSILKANSGQTSTLNSGFAASHGEVVCFLDADDVLLPTALEHAVEQFREGVVKVHWPLRVVDADGTPNGRLKPGDRLPGGDLRDVVIRDGPDSPVWAPTSGNAWARTFLAQIMPIPEMERALAIGSASADAYLSMLAPLFGRVGRLAEPHALYRVHGQNDHSCMPFERRLDRDLKLFEWRAVVLARFCGERDLKVDPSQWARHCWFHRLSAALNQIASVVPIDQPFVLIDANQWMTSETVAGRRRVPFLEREGRYWGLPPDDTVAIHELERLHSSGVRFAALGWPAFWVLDHYDEFAEYVSKFYRPIESEQVVVFDLDRQSSAR